MGCLGLIERTHLLPSANFTTARVLKPFPGGHFWHIRNSEKWKCTHQELSFSYVRELQLLNGLLQVIWLYYSALSTSRQRVCLPKMYFRVIYLSRNSENVLMFFSFWVFCSQIPIITRMLSREWNVLCRAVTCYICIFPPDTSNFNKWALPYTLLSETKSTLKIPSNLQRLKTEPRTVAVCVFYRQRCYWLRHRCLPTPLRCLLRYGERSIEDILAVLSLCPMPELPYWLF